MALQADVLEHIGSPVRSGSHAELDSAAKSLGCWSPNFLMKKVTRPLKRSASTSPANSGSTTPGRNDSVAAPQKMMQRWQQSIAETNPTWGWCGVQGWPLDIWCAAFHPRGGVWAIALCCPEHSPTALCLQVRIRPPGNALPHWASHHPLGGRFANLSGERV